MTMTPNVAYMDRRPDERNGERTEQVTMAEASALSREGGTLNLFLIPRQIHPAPLPPDGLTPPNITNSPHLLLLPPLP